MINSKHGNDRILNSELFNDLPDYSKLDILILKNSILDAVKGYTKALSKNQNKEDKWFGALDIFCGENHKDFLKEYEVVNKFINDWKRVKQDNDHSARCHFGRIFYQTLAETPDMEFNYRKFSGKNFEYIRVK